MNSPHGLLKAKRRKVRKQSQAIAKKLRSSAATHHGGAVTADLHQLQKTLAALRKDVQRSGGAGAKDVADALGHLDTSVGKLIEAQHIGKGNNALTVLAEGTNALDAAQAAAKAAGHAWQL
jgi:hypothetical protein